MRAVSIPTVDNIRAAVSTLAAEDSTRGEVDSADSEAATEDNEKMLAAIS